MTAISVGGVTKTDPPTRVSLGVTRTPGFEGGLDTGGSPLTGRTSSGLTFPNSLVRLQITGSRAFAGGAPTFARSTTGITFRSWTTSVNKQVGPFTRTPAALIQSQRTAGGRTVPTFPVLYKVTPPPTFTNVGMIGQRRRVNSAALDNVRFADAGGTAMRVRAGFGGSWAYFDAAPGDAPRARSAVAGFDLADLVVAGGTGVRSRTGVSSPDLLELVDFGGAAGRVRSGIGGFDEATAWPIGGLASRARVNHAAMEQRFPPDNDLLADATVLSGLSGTVDYSVVAALVETDEPDLTDATGPAGTVWFSWAPDFEGDATFATDPGVRLEVYSRVGVTPPPPFEEDWYARGPYSLAGWYTGAWLKLYRIVTTEDIPFDALWTGPNGAPDNDPSGVHGQLLEIDLWDGPPGDPSVVGYGSVTGDGHENYQTWTSTLEDGTQRTRSTSVDIPAGTTLWLLAQQWPDADLTDPVVTWDPASDMGSFTLTDGVTPLVPWDLSTIEQVELPGGETVAPPPPPPPAGPFDALTPAGGGNGLLAFQTRAGEEYVLRAYPLDGDHQPDDLELTWDAEMAAIAVTLPVSTVSTPGVLAANISGEAPGETIEFTFDGDLTVRGTTVTGVDGSASYVSVQLPLLPDGAHLLIARGEGGRTGNVAFLSASTEYVPPPSPPPPPSDPLPPNIVTRWQFEDPTDGTTWNFPINPDGADSVMLGRTFQTSQTTAVVGGQRLVFEGGLRPKSWTFKGTFTTLDDLNALKAWRTKPYRVYVTDDLGRAFIVKVVSVVATPVRDVLLAELHSYVVTCLLYGRVVTI